MIHQAEQNSRRPRILIVDEEPLIREFLTELMRRKSYEVDCAASPAHGCSLMGSNRYAIVFADIQGKGQSPSSILDHAMSESPETAVVAMSADPTVESAVDAMRQGASDYLPKPFSSVQLDQLLERINPAVEGEHSQVKNPGARHHSDAPVLVGQSRQMQEVLKLIKIAAPTDVTVLISGETGTGKELVARAIHNQSKRSRGPFIRFNCGALTESLYESELFGHEKGAFTGAVRQKRGRFELANGGTLLMDEISEISWSTQANFLRVLQEREFERVGGCSTIRVDTRVIATTNRDLSREIREERFRSDLYYRLSVFPISVAPLRERGEDIPLLTEHFLRLHCERNGLLRKRLSSAAEKLVNEYDWPGNVRQLENSLERAALISPRSVIEPEHLPELTTNVSCITQTEGGVRGDVAGRVLPPNMTLREMETELLIRALKETGGNRTEAANRLGITTRTLRNKLHRMGRMDFLKVSSCVGE